MKIWDAKQRGEKDGKRVGIKVALVIVFKCLHKDMSIDNQCIAKIMQIQI
jgi:hypothetical protein